MPSAGRTDLPLKGYNGGEQYEERGTDWGDMDVVHAQFPAGDLAPLLRGLPDDRCQCPHWGYVVSGKLTFRFADHDEVFEAGDAFYAPPGHIPVKHEPGSEAVFFSPAEELAKTDAVMMKNMQAMQAG